MKNFLFIIALLFSSQSFAQDFVTDKAVIKKIQTVIEKDFQNQGLNAEYKFIIEDLFQDEYTAFYKIKNNIPANNYTIGQGVSYKYKVRNNNPDSYDPKNNYAIVDGTEKFEIGKEETTILIGCPLKIINSFVSKYNLKDMPDYTRYDKEYDYAIIVIEFAKESTLKSLNNITVANFTLVNKQKRTGYDIYTNGKINEKEETEIDSDVMKFLP